ncbi:MAG: GSCFA domain-containing protein [Lentisphaerales bacterium]|nr:GSCFA domain-containing protein [Lentisphaerales bacterium]
MMKFRTEIKVARELDLKPEFKLVTLGSCFADRIGDYFAKLGIESCLNPYGVIYNPISISTLLDSTIEGDSIGDWEQKDELWLNTMYHGQFSHDNQSFAKERLSETVSGCRKSLEQADLLIITLGTSYAYKDIKSGEIVTNCHRLPADRFARVLLSVDEMYKQLKAALEQLFTLNSALNVVLTVSPVRHVRDSLVKNQLSKAQLVCLVHKLVGELKQVLYFPSYEILLDDLRDYRFYDEGLVQPSSQALIYVQEKFRSFAFSDDLHRYETAANKLLKKLSHIPITESQATQKFKERREQELKEFLAIYPFSKIYA